MPSLDNYTLNIMKWKKDWNQIIHDAEDSKKELLLTIARLTQLLDDIDDFKAISERLAWLNFWSKTFSALDGSIAAIDRKSEYLLKIISRNITEVCLHGFTIFGNNIPDNSKCINWDIILDRLRAYTAWGLWNDRQLIYDLSKRENLDQAWDPKPTQELITNPEQHEFHEIFFGPLVIENESDLLKMRINQEEYLKKQKIRLNDWLNHRNLKKWYNLLQEKKPISFFGLLDIKEKSINKKLKSLNFGFVYSMYKQGSMVIHGSTLEQFYALDEMKITPLFGNGNNIESLINIINTNCTQIMLFLAMSKRQLWPNA